MSRNKGVNFIYGHKLLGFFTYGHKTHILFNIVTTIWGFSSPVVTLTKSRDVTTTSSTHVAQREKKVILNSKKKQILII